jgi:serine/threonine-protein kinase
MLCEILTGQPPYIGNDLRRLFVSAANAELHAAFERLDRCGEDPMLIRLAKSCLSADPHDRPPDAVHVALQISAFLETALRDAQADLTRFFDLSLDLFCIASFDGYFLRVNSNFSRVLGYPSSQLVSKAFMEFVHPDDRQPTVDAMGALMTGNPVIRFRNRYRNVAGEYVCFEWTAKSITDEKIVFAVAREIPDGWLRTP